MKTNYIFILLVLGIGLPSGFLPAQDADQDRINTDAYLALMDADGLVEDGEPAEALKLYRESRNAYRELRETDPEFKSTMIAYRLRELDTKIAALEKRLPGGGETVSDNDPSPSPTPVEEDFKALYLETREKMLRDGERLLELEKRNIEMVVTLREQRERLTENDARLQELSRQVKKGTEQSERDQAKLRKEVKDLARFNNLLQERADKLEVAGGELREQRDTLRAEAETLSETLTQTRTDLEETRKNLKLAEMEGSTREQQLILARNQLRDDLQSATRELEAAHEQVETLKADVNELPLLEETVIELNTRNENQSAQIAELEAQLKSIRAELAAAGTLETELTAARDRAVAETETLTEEKQVAEQDLEALRSELAALGEENADLKKELEKGRRTLEKAEKLIEEAERIKWESRDDVKALKKENKNVADRLEIAETTLAEREEKLTVLEKRLLDTRLNLEQEKQARDQLQETAGNQLKTIAERMNEVTELRRKLNAREMELEGLRAEMIDVAADPEGE